MQEIVDKLIELFKQPEKTRILAFGSSNTERFLPGMHWFDCFELALKHTYGRVHTCINTGVGGNTSSQLLERFEDDAARYLPHLAIITVGGNDSNPDLERNHTPEKFAAVLQELYERFTAMGTMVVYQTYYSPDPDQCDPQHIKNFYELMDVTRRVAAENNAGLVDHLKRWEAFRDAYPTAYKALMRDAFHVHPAGNMVLGADLARNFNAGFDTIYPEIWQETFAIQQKMDQLT
jgi:acyl-CoA thioesterase I